MSVKNIFLNVITEEMSTGEAILTTIGLFIVSVCIMVLIFVGAFVMIGFYRYIADAVKYTNLCHDKFKPLYMMAYLKDELSEGYEEYFVKGGSDLDEETKMFSKSIFWFFVGFSYVVVRHIAKLIKKAGDFLGESISGKKEG